MHPFAFPLMAAAWLRSAGCVHARVARQLTRTGGILVTAERAPRELEKLKGAELIVKGDEIHAEGKRMKMNDARHPLSTCFNSERRPDFWH